MKKMISGNGKESREKANKKGKRSDSKLQAEVRSNDRITPYGGLGAVKMLIRRTGFKAAIEERLKLFKQYHGDYTESTHIMTSVQSMLAGGTKLKSIKRIKDYTVAMKNSPGSDTRISHCNHLPAFRAFSRPVSPAL